MLYRAYDVKSLLHSGAANALGLRMGMCKYGYLGGFCDGAHASTAACAHSRQILRRRLRPIVSMAVERGAR